MNTVNLRGFNELHQPAYNSKFMHRSYENPELSLTKCKSPQDYGTIIPDCVTRAPSLNVFKTMLNNVNLTTGIKCYCNFCT